MKLVKIAMGVVLSGVLVSAVAGPQDRSGSGLTVYLREATRTFVLGPGQSEGVSSACRSGETVVGGSPTNIPNNVAIAYSALFFDGVSSGWTVQYRNDSAQAVSVYAATSALCTAGKLIPG